MSRRDQPLPPTAEEASPRQLRRAALRLLLMLVALAVLVVPLIRGLPLGLSTRIALLAWLLVALAFYWLYQGMGYRPLLLMQLLLFSIAATLLSAKLLLVIVDVNQVDFLRRVARWFIMLGAACAAANLGAMLVGLAQRSRQG